MKTTRAEIVMLILVGLALLVVALARPSDARSAGSGTEQGTLSFVDRSYGPLYLAIPEPRGTIATICGPAACVTRASTDYGPDQRVHPDRIADLSAVDFETVCGVSTSFGLCPGSVTILRRPGLLTLPPTDTIGR